MILLVIILSWLIFSILAFVMFCKALLYTNDITCLDLIHNIVLSLFGPISFLAAVMTLISIWINITTVLDKVIWKRKENK